MAANHAVFQHSGEYNLYYNMTAAQKAQWQKWSGNNPRGTFDNWLSKYGPGLGLPSRAPAAAPGDAGGSPGATSAPAFDPQQQADYNSKFWDILYAGQGNEADYADTVLNDKMVQNAIELNFKKAKSADAEDESGRGILNTGYSYNHFADIDADRQRSIGDEANVFRLATDRYNANIARFNSNLAQLGEEGNIGKFLNVANIAAGTAGTGAVAPAAAPRSIAPAAAPSPAPVAQPHAPEGYGNPQYDPKAGPQPVSTEPHNPKHELAPGYSVAPEPVRTKLNAVEYSRRLKEIRDRHGAGSAQVSNFRNRNYY